MTAILPRNFSQLNSNLTEKSCIIIDQLWMFLTFLEILVASLRQWKVYHLSLLFSIPAYLGIQSMSIYYKIHSLRTQNSWIKNNQQIRAHSFKNFSIFDYVRHLSYPIFFALVRGIRMREKWFDKGYRR